jgi:DNA helicase II / ATP-dependent DNA helicase PcrA
MSFCRVVCGIIKGTTMAKEVSLDDLTPSQKEAVLHAGGPVLVLSGAGSGKTLVLTCRFSSLVKKKKLPTSSIFTVTFSNRAADEMKRRISSLTGCDHKQNWIGTLHSHCSRILRKDIGAIGFKPNFIIFDEDDQNSLIRNILKEFNIYEALYKGVSARISMLKSSLISPEDFLSQGDGFSFDEKLGRVYMRYQDELKRCNSLDHDDLILSTVKLFEKNPDILKKYINMFPALLVDEFQDTTRSQYRLLQLLAGKKMNICAVGDDDQSIYRFRGADISNILNFTRDFPGARIIKIDQNFRTSQNILKVCGSVIAGKGHSKPKTLKTICGCGEKVFYRCLNNEEEEAKCVARSIKDLYLKSNYEFDKFAVFYRVNLQTKALEDALRDEDIPFHVIGGSSFYQKKEVKDIISYMRLALNCNDNVSLRRVINSPARGIGVTTINKIEQEARKNSASLFKTMKVMLHNNGIAPSFKDKLSSFVKTVDRFSSHSYKNAPDMIKDIVEKTGYLDDLEEERIENVLELASSADNIAPMDFLDRISLPLTNAPPIPGKSVSLAPLHSAKGLEFDVVFIIGIEEGILPYFKAFDNAAEMQEERRLFYVGMTRASQILSLSSAKRRRLYSKIQEHEPSRFLADIPRECCTWVERSVQKEKKTSDKMLMVPLKKIPSFIIGARVKHPAWGEGIVRDCSGDGEETKVTVNFPGIGIKRLQAKLANLERI